MAYTAHIKRGGPMGDGAGSTGRGIIAWIRRQLTSPYTWGVIAIAAIDALLGHQTVTLVIRNSKTAAGAAGAYFIATVVAPYLACKWYKKGSLPTAIVAGVVAIAAVTAMFWMRWSFGAGTDSAALSYLNDAERAAREGRNHAIAILMLIFSLVSVAISWCHAIDDIDRENRELRERKRALQEEISRLRSVLDPMDEDPQLFAFDAGAWKVQTVREGASKKQLLRDMARSKRKELALHLIGLFESPHDAQEFLKRLRADSGEAAGADEGGIRPSLEVIGHA